MPAGRGVSVGGLCRRKSVGGAGEFQREACELLHVHGRQRFESLGAGGGELEPDDAVVSVVARAADESCGVGTIDETDGAVVA